MNTYISLTILILICAVVAYFIDLGCRKINKYVDKKIKEYFSKDESIFVKKNIGGK